MIQDPVDAFSHGVEGLCYRFDVLGGRSLLLIDDGAGCILRNIDHGGGQELSFVRC